MFQKGLCSKQLILPTHFVGNVLANQIRFSFYFCHTKMNLSALFQVLKMTEDLELLSKNCDIINLQYSMVVQEKSDRF
jgi:hypothetical protein